MIKLKQIASLIVAGFLIASCGSKGGIDTYLIPVGMDDKCYVLNLKGAVILDDENYQGAVFSNGLCQIKKDGKQGYIDRKGKVVIEPRFKTTSSFREGIAWITEEGTYPQAINTKGKVLFMMEKAECVGTFQEGLAMFMTFDADGQPKCGYVNTSGKVVIEPAFAAGEQFSNGKAVIYDSEVKKFGYIDKKGTVIIDCQFDAAESFFSSDLACVKFGKKWGVINAKGEYVINPIFEEIQADGDWFKFNDDGKIGWCDREGKYIINPQFYKAYLFGENDLAPVYNGDKWGYINKKGLIQIPYQFDRAYSFIDNQTAVVSLNRKYGLINEVGKYIVNPQYTEVNKNFLMYVSEDKKGELIPSDYFSTQEVVDVLQKLINERTIWNMPITGNMWDILSIFNMDEKKFPKTYTSTRLAQRRINSDVELDFFMEGMPWIKQKEGWFASYAFNYDDMPNYCIRINLSNRRADKAEALTRAIYNAFTPDEKIEQAIEEGDFVSFFKDLCLFNIRYLKHNVFIQIEPSRP